MDIKLDNIFGNLLKKKEESVVGLDIGSAFVKVVQLRRKGAKAVLDTYGEIALGPLAGLEVGQSTQLPPEKIAEAVIDLMKEAKVTSHDIAVSLPVSSALLTVIEMPDLGDAKLKEMIPIEARKYIPTAVSEVALNWWVIPKGRAAYVDPDVEEKNKGQAMVDVLLAAVHNDVMAKYHDITKRIGATDFSPEIEVFSAIRSALARESTLTMLVDIGASSTKVAIVDEGIIRSSHLINAGSQDVTLALSRSLGVPILDAEEIKREKGLVGDPNDPSVAEVTRIAVERIVAEISRIYAKYQRDKHVVVGSIVLSGGGALLKGLPDLMHQTFEGANILMANVFDRVESPAVLEELLKEASPEFAIAMGLAMRRL
jgi:type IV pilus assembly protein PilM